MHLEQCLVFFLLLLKQINTTSIPGQLVTDICLRDGTAICVAQSMRTELNRWTDFTTSIWAEYSLQNNYLAQESTTEIKL